MPISSVVISCRPAKVKAVAAGLKIFPQLEIHHQLASGSLIAVMETATVDEEVSLVKEIMQTADVLDVRLAYHNFEDLQELQIKAKNPEKRDAVLVMYPFLDLDNSRCLAQKGGCFACIDHCPKEAVNIALGVGVVIDPELCDGCGECAAVCPIDPKVIEMKTADTESNTPMIVSKVP